MGTIAEATIFCQGNRRTISIGAVLWKTCGVCGWLPFGSWDCRGKEIISKRPVSHAEHERNIPRRKGGSRLTRCPPDIVSFVPTTDRSPRVASKAYPQPSFQTLSFSQFLKDVRHCRNIPAGEEQNCCSPPLARFAMPFKAVQTWHSPGSLCNGACAPRLE